MSKKNEEDNDQYYVVEHILCERKTRAPKKRQKGPKQYLVKYENYDFDDCYWIHKSSIKPHGPNTPFAKWNRLKKIEKQERYDFLCKRKLFMRRTPKEKINIGWKYVHKFNLEIFVQTPDMSPAKTIVETLTKPHPQTWKGNHRMQQIEKRKKK